MSSILKALKKVEKDKKNYRPEQLGVDARILQDGSSAGFSRTTAVLLAVSLFVCGGGATYVYLKHEQTEQPAQIRQISPSRPVESENHIRIPTPVIKSSVLNTASTQKNPTVPDALHRSVKASETTARPGRINLQPTTLPSVEPHPVSAPAAPVNTANRPALTVNGIAFQEGGSDNMAIINGTTVSSGASIEGVKVEDILKDRVRFSQNGEKFEILLNKSNR